MPRDDRYVVRLDAGERQGLIDLVRTGKRAAATLTRARILLKADVGPYGEAWDDEPIADALETSLSTIHRVRQAFVEDGLEEALYRKKPSGRQYHKLDGDQEAHPIAVACSRAPEGRSRWTLRLLADKLVELQVVESISPECVRTTLKKTSSSRGCRSSG
jgi:transposase